MKKILVILIICLFLCSCASTSVFKNVTIDTNFPVSSKLSMSMVGDALIHEPIYKDAYIDGRYDFSSMFSDFKYMVEDTDLLYYNAETIAGGERLGYSGYPSFNTPKEFHEEMINMGFNVVSRANNHTLDKGESGILNACNFWNEHSSVLTNGSACTREEKDNVRVLEKNNIRYALLSYTVMTNGNKSKKDYYVNIYSDELAKRDIDYLKNDAELIIVAMHWGDEYRSTPNEAQKRIAKYLSDLGVNIIVGTHPHVIEPIEWINDTLVIYSLGNFISAQVTNNEYERRIGLMVNLDIIKTVINNKNTIQLANVNTELLYTYSNNMKNYKVIPFSKLDDTILNNYSYYHEKYNNIVRMYDNTISTN